MRILCVADLVAAIAAGTACAAFAGEISFEDAGEAAFGGIGFQNAEAEIAVLMPDDFRDQRVLKSFREISPTFSRVYAGFADCPREQADRFADWYDLTFRRAGTELYAVGGMMPFVAEGETEAWAEKVAANLEYLIKVRGCTNIRHYCMTNELGIDGCGDWYFRNMDRFRQLHAALRSSFDRHGLQSVGLAATDVNQHVELSLKQLDWAAKNMDDITSIYCTHWYMFMGGAKDGRLVLPSSPKNAATMQRHFSSLVAKAAEVGKRYFVGEIGLWTPSTQGVNRVMHDDTGYPLRAPEHAGEGAMALAEIALTAMNEGAYAAASWSFVDYPDPFVFEPSGEPEDDAVYQSAKCVYWPNLKYNKWGLFRWDSVDRNYRAYPSLYTMGHLARLFRRGARVLKVHTDDTSLRGGCVVSRDGSVSMAVINWAEKKEISVRCGIRTKKPLRVYEYDSAHPPDNAFNDLQAAIGTVEAKDGVVSLVMPARSMVFLTTDYEDHVPAAVAHISLQKGVLGWSTSEENEHRYYRVYRDGRQIASTVATLLSVSEAKPEDAVRFSVVSVDKWGNAGKMEYRPDVTITKPYFRWLFYGFGVQASATNSIGMHYTGTCGDNQMLRRRSASDLGLWSDCGAVFSNIVQKSIRENRRYVLGGCDIVSNDEAESALAECEIGLAAMNSGVAACMGSGNVCQKWLTRFFRKNSTVLPCAFADQMLRGGAVMNPDRSVSIALVNRGPGKTVAVDCSSWKSRIDGTPSLHQPLRKYVYQVENVPYSPFNDLQQISGTVVPTDGAFSVKLPAKSITFLTTDYNENLHDSEHCSLH